MWIKASIVILIAMKSSYTCICVRGATAITLKRINGIGTMFIVHLGDKSWLKYLGNLDTACIVMIQLDLFVTIFI